MTLRISLAALLLRLCCRWLPGKSPRGRDLLKTCLMGVIVFVVTPRLQVIATRLVLGLRQVSLTFCSCSPTTSARTRSPRWAIR